MSCDNRVISLLEGKSLALPVRYGSDKIVYRAISAISLSAGAPRITIDTTDLPDGWPVAITRVLGMTQINAENSPPEDSDYKSATVIDATTIELNGIDPTGWKPYVSGGFVQWHEPADLADFKARAHIRRRKGAEGEPLFVMTSENGLIDIDNTEKITTLYFDSEDFTGLDWRTGWIELELYKSDTRTIGAVTKETEYTVRLLDCEITIDKETARA